MQLSEHFTLQEGTDSSTAQRLGIDNTPPAEIIEHMKISAAGAEQVRAILGFPMHIDSWYRCEALEKALTEKDYVRWCNAHGHPVNADSWKEYFARKAHPQGFAIDFLCPQFGNPEAIVKKLKSSGIKFDQLLMEGTWVHISFAPAMRGIVELVTFTNGTPSYKVVS